jgi:RNA polymerase sigma-70 factor (ECF subfamily)
MERLKKEFLDILSSYQGILHKVTLVYFREKAEREDMFQEILYQLWKAFPKLKKRESIGSWIYKVAINTSLSQVNKNRRLEFRKNLPELSGSGNAEENLIKNEEIRLLIDAIHRLNEIDKTIMLLYLERKSYDEMAEITGLSVSNIGVKINRAKKELYQHLTKIYHERK